MVVCEPRKCQERPGLAALIGAKDEDESKILGDEVEPFELRSLVLNDSSVLCGFTSILGG